MIIFDSSSLSAIFSLSAPVKGLREVEFVPGFCLSRPTIADVANAPPVV
jgi:hypothetical protein